MSVDVESFAINGPVESRYKHNESKGDIPRSGDMLNKFGLLLDLRQFRENGMTPTLHFPRGKSADECVVMLKTSGGDYVIHRYVWSDNEWEFSQPHRYADWDTCEATFLTY